MQDVDPFTLRPNSLIATTDSPKLNAPGMGEYVELKKNQWKRHEGAAGPGHLARDGTSEFGRILEVGLWQQVEA